MAKFSPLLLRRLVIGVACVSLVVGAVSLAIIAVHGSGDTYVAAAASETTTSDKPTTSTANTSTTVTPVTAPPVTAAPVTAPPAPRVTAPRVTTPPYVPPTTAPYVPPTPVENYLNAVRNLKAWSDEQFLAFGAQVCTVLEVTKGSEAQFQAIEALTGGDSDLIVVSADAASFLCPGLLA